MDDEIHAFDSMLSLVDSEKFDKFGGYFIDKARNITEVSKLSHVSRPTIYVYLKELERFNNYVKHGTLFKGERLSITMDLVIDYLSKKAKLKTEEKGLLRRIFSNAVIRNIALKWYGTASFSEIIQRSVFSIIMLNINKDLYEYDKERDRESPITRFGIYNVLMLGLEDRKGFDSLAKEFDKDTSKTLKELANKLLSIPKSRTNMFSEPILQIMASYELLDSAISKLPNPQKRQIEKKLWDSYAATS